jgi:hypothetical protein
MAHRSQKWVSEKKNMQDSPQQLETENKHCLFAKANNEHGWNLLSSSKFDLLFPIVETRYGSFSDIKHLDLK